MLASDPQRTMRYWLALVLREAREDAGVKHVEIAGRLRMSAASIRRFELGESWPTHPDQYLAAYAEFTDVDDPIEFWQDAINRWRDQGLPPIVEVADRRPTDRAVDAARRAARLATRDRSEPRDGSPPEPLAIVTALVALAAP